MPNIPNITVYRLNDEPVLQQNYDNWRVETVSDFNNITQSSQYICYLYPGFDFNQKDTLAIATKKFAEYPMIHGIYSDISVQNIISYSPAFCIGNIERKTIVNSPLIVNKPLNFNNQIQHLHYLYVLLTTVQNTMWYHIPHPLFQLKEIPMDHIQSDLKLIYGLR